MTPERWQQIEALYHAARERPLAERAAFLVSSCPDDDDLRREVDQLLSQPGSQEGFLAGQSPAVAAALAHGSAPLTGRTLGVYQVQALVGIGGMGEVYRARDGKLGRTVAIKVLPHAFTSDPARLARFDREARTLAALNHPNICAIYGFEEAEQVRFLVLELVEGQTLADRLAASRQHPAGPGLPQREALNVAHQIARALDFAHNAGIVHRDLKPANIKVLADGTVKVLDFGLAKAATGESAGADLEPRPGDSAHDTIDGAILGTPVYMSPEQARGKAVDKRTDIWAFGCILYEMLTGRVAFAGETMADTIATVLEHEPDWSLLPAATLEPVRDLLLGCLAKDPQERPGNIGDVRNTIDSLLSGPSGPAIAVSPAARARPRAAWRRWAGAAAVGIIVVAGLGWSARHFGKPSGPQVIDLPPGQEFDGSGGAHVLTLSRDGNQLAFVAKPLLGYLRNLDSANREATPIPGIDKYKNVRDVTYSSDGKHVVFYAFDDHTIKRVTLAGGEPLTICDALTPTGIDLSPGGVLLFGQGKEGIWKASENTTGATQVARVGPGYVAHGPQFLPDNDHFLFTIATGGSRDRWDKAQIVVGSLSSDEVVKLPVSGSDARYLRTEGVLLYVRNGSIYAIKFDPVRLTVEGTGVSVQDGVSRAPGAVTGAANFSVSDTGTLAYVPGGLGATEIRREIGLFDLANRRLIRKLNAPPGQYNSLRASPDESTIAFGDDADKETASIRTLALDGGSGIQVLPNEQSANRYPVWTPNSKRLVFQSTRGGDRGIWWQMADGSDQAQRLTRPPGGESDIPESWFEDTLLFSRTKGDNEEVSLWTVDVRAGTPGMPKRFGRATATGPMSAVFSPDGRVVAYAKTVDSDTTICIEPFPATNAPNQCLPPNLADSPKHPRWSQDGRIFFDPRLGDFESVPVTTSPTLQFGPRQPESYHPFQLAPPGYRTPYDITKSGKFLGLITAGFDQYERSLLTRIIVVRNWFEILKIKMAR